MTESRSVLPALLIGVGVALAGLFISRGFVEFRTADRYVTVKGVAERDVTADLALWIFRIVGSSDNLSRAQAEIDRGVDTIFAFLTRYGVDTTGAERQGLEVTDRFASGYGKTEDGGPRFVVQQTLMVRSEDPELMQAASAHLGELVEAGVVLKSGRGYGPTSPVFIFRKLNDIKPAMIAEATAAAREAAEQFAADSRSTLGGIRNANQGVFVIKPRDQAPIDEAGQLHKTVRVVTTVQYYLQD